ncbi:hypothetical protein J3458_000888 [Metarhizium acridum]|uniref:uncharacterized protein n=1 Tax=Metarhizium acridum TaxID=92637 RepID=UPI001C6CDD0D|nr:hypothetical protein J3458_000888 [Metarhizium acridum]
MPSCHGGHCLGILGGEVCHGRACMSFVLDETGLTLISPRGICILRSTYTTASGVGKEASCERYTALRRMEDAVVAMLMVGQQQPIWSGRMVLNAVRIPAVVELLIVE